MADLYRFPGVQRDVSSPAIELQLQQAFERGLTEGKRLGAEDAERQLKQQAEQAARAEADSQLQNAVTELRQQFAQQLQQLEQHYQKQDLLVSTHVHALIEIKNTQLYINGKPATNPAKMQHGYILKTTKEITDVKPFEELGIYNGIDAMGHENNNLVGPYQGDSSDTKKGYFVYVVNTFESNIAKLKQLDGVKEIIPIISPKGERMEVGPNIIHQEDAPMSSTLYNWNRDNFGAIQVPKAGLTIQLDSMNIDCFAKYANDAEAFSKLEFKNNSKITLDDDDNVCIVATKKIKSQQEIFCSYGVKYWKKHK